MKAGRQGKHAENKGKKKEGWEGGREDTIHRNGFVSLLIFTLHPIDIVRVDMDYFH